MWPKGEEVLEVDKYELGWKEKVKQSTETFFTNVTRRLYSINLFTETLKLTYRKDKYQKSKKST